VTEFFWSIFTCRLSGGPNCRRYLSCSRNRL